MAFSLRKGLFAVVGGLVLLIGTAKAQYAAATNMDAPDPYNQPPPPGRVSWLKSCFQRHNCCCASHHNDLGCTSGGADCKFIFGSCRTFWSESCPWGPSPYKFVPPQSTRPPSQRSLGCASCQ